MKLLHFSDLHAHTAHLTALLDICKEEQPDIVAISGDMTNWTDSPNHDRRTLKHVQTFMEKLNKTTPIAFCSGNHEAWTLKQNTEEFNLTCIDNQSILFKDWIISSYPWSDTGFNGEAFKQEEILRRENPTATIVWLHHEPALGSACAWNGFSNDGNFILQHHIRDYKPSYVLSGHIHCAPFAGGKAVETMFNTTCCNPGSSATREDEFYTTKPPFIRITERGAEWLPAKK